MSRKFFYGWVVVAACFACLFVIFGLTYSFAVFVPSIVNEFGWSEATVMGSITLQMITYGIVSFISGYIIEKYLDTKWKLRLFFYLGSFSIFLAWVAISHTTEVWHLYLSYGLLFGAGAGILGFVVLSSIIRKWFSKKAGLAQGISVAGAGLGNLAFAVYAGFSIEVGGISSTALFMGLLGLITIIASTFILRQPEDVGLLPDGELGHGKVIGSKRVGMGPRQFKVGEAVGTKVFWILRVSQILAFTGVFAILFFLARYLTGIGMPLSFAAATLGVVGLISVAGRILIGKLSDILAQRIGNVNSRKYLLVLCYISMAVGVLALINAQSFGLLYLYVIIFGAGYGGSVALGIPLAGDLFGSKYLATISGLGIILSLPAAFGPSLMGYLHEVTKSYTSTLMFPLMSFLCASILMMFVRRPRLPSRIKKD